MCTVSNIGDMWGKTTWPGIKPDWFPENPAPSEPPLNFQLLSPQVTKQEFDNFVTEVRKELESLKKLLVAAKIYDEETGQKDCEQAEKVALFKRLAELTGVDLSEVFKNG